MAKEEHFLFDFVFDIVYNANVNSVSICRCRGFAKGIGGE